MSELTTIEQLSEVQLPGLYELRARPSGPAVLRMDTTAFLGLCAEGPVLVPTLVESWQAFGRVFGARGAGRLLPEAVRAFFANGGRRAVIVRASEQGGDARREDVLAGLEPLERYDEDQQTAPVSLICAPDLLHVDERPPAEPVEEQAHVAEDLRFHEACLPTGSTRTEAAAPRFPSLARPATLTELLEAAGELRAFAERGRRMALIDLPPGLDSQGVATARRALASPRVALYAPWLLGPASEASDGQRRRIPPSGAVAGLIADAGLRRGPWRAPGNLPLQGGYALHHDPYLPSPAALFEHRVNLIRDTPRGPTLLDARTTALAAESEWTQISARLLVDWLCGQLALDLRWAAFEPQGQRLTRRLILAVTHRLDALHQAQALAGEDRAEAWFVRCEPALNGPEVSDAGRVVIEVGVAPAAPAEFLVVRLDLQRDGSMEVADG